MRKKILVALLKYALALLAAVIILFPIYWMIISAFKAPNEILTYPPKLIPSKFTFDNFVTAFRDYNMLHITINSVIVTLSTMVLTITISAFAGYAMCFFQFAPAKAINSLMYLIQVLPAVTMLVPLFALYRIMGLLNTYTSLILTYTAATTGIPIALVMICGYYQGTPMELFESASIDGSGPTQTFFKILLPLAAPGLFCTAIYIFVQTWQEYMFASNLITDSSMYTLPVGLQIFVGMRSTDWGGMMATATVVAVPAIILFVCIQKHFVDNLAGAVKE